MANYCECILNLKSSRSATIERLIDVACPKKKNTFISCLKRVFGGPRLLDQVGLLEFCVPMPPKLKSTITNGFSGAAPEWHDWQVENWGCAYDVAVDSINRISRNEVQFRFQSRYSPPLPAIQLGAKRHDFQFRLVYCESGSQFAGIATHCEHQQFEFSFDVHPSEEGVPEEIIEEFSLTEIYHELKEDPGA